VWQLWREERPASLSRNQGVIKGLIKKAHSREERHSLFVTRSVVDSLGCWPGAPEDAAVAEAAVLAVDEPDWLPPEEAVWLLPPLPPPPPAELLLLPLLAAAEELLLLLLAPLPPPPPPEDDILLENGKREVGVWVLFEALLPRIRVHFFSSFPSHTLPAKKSQLFFSNDPFSVLTTLVLSFGALQAQLLPARRTHSLLSR